MHERTEWALEATKKMFQRRHQLETLIAWLLGIFFGYCIGHYF